MAKSYGPVVALRSVDLDVVPGEIHALLGANGAGKSTLVKILSGVLREGMGLAVVGLAIGIVGAFFLMRTAESMLYEIEPTDPTSFAVVSVIFLGVAWLAVWIPARRATRIDPMEVLRYE